MDKPQGCCNIKELCSFLHVHYEYTVHEWSLPGVNYTAAILTHLGSHWLARLGVVKVGGDVKLQQLTELSDDVLWGAILILTFQPVVCLDDLSQLVCQVILRPVGK